MRYVLRAFRGTRRSSVYQEHVLPEDSFVRVVEAGKANELRLLSSLADDVRELSKTEARELAAELDTLRRSQQLPDLDAQLVAAAELARWCARSKRPARLRLEPRPD